VREARIFTLPLALGRGVRLFPERAAATERWRLLSARAYPCGTVGAVYAVEAG
jgi:dihydrofolate reductase